MRCFPCQMIPNLPLVHEEYLNECSSPVATWNCSGGASSADLGPGFLFFFRVFLRIQRGNVFGFKESAQDKPYRHEERDE